MLFAFLLSLFLLFIVFSFVYFTFFPFSTPFFLHYQRFSPSKSNLFFSLPLFHFTCFHFCPFSVSSFFHLYFEIDERLKVLRLFHIFFFILFTLSLLRSNSLQCPSSHFPSLFSLVVSLSCLPPSPHCPPQLFFLSQLLSASVACTLLFPFSPRVL